MSVNKRLTKLTLTMQVTNLTNQVDWLAKDNLILRTKLEEYRKNEIWFKQLIQEMSSTMNAGAKEGSFPRRN